MKSVLYAIMMMFAIMITGPLYAKNVYGFVEHVTLLPENIALKAKLDTGAKTASLNADNIKSFTYKGEPWVEFIININGKSVIFKRKLQKYIKIKQRIEESKEQSNTKGYSQRPEVLMKIRLGHEEKVILVDLANRKNFIYPLLLGRDAIKRFHGMIDPSESFLTPQEHQEHNDQGK